MNITIVKEYKFDKPYNCGFSLDIKLHKLQPE